MRRLLGVLCVVAAAACSGDSDGASTTTVDAGTSTTASFAETSTTATIAPAGCPDPLVPAVTVAMAEAAGDVDGDGATDRLMTYGVGSAEDPSPWHLRVELGAGGGYDAEIPDAPGFAPVRVLGTADISDDGAAELFAVVNSGASVALVGVFQWDDCAVVRLTGPVGSEPSVFPVGGTVTHLDGLACVDARLLALSATSEDGESYVVHLQALDLADGAFTPLGPLEENTLAGDDPSLGNYASIDCPGIESP